MKQSKDASCKKWELVDDCIFWYDLEPLCKQQRCCGVYWCILKYCIMIGFLKKTWQHNFTSTNVLTLCQLYESFNHFSFFLELCVFYWTFLSHVFLFVGCIQVCGPIAWRFQFIFIFLAIYGQTLVTSCTFGYFYFPCSFSWWFILPHIKYLSFSIRYMISQKFI